MMVGVGEGVMMVFCCSRVVVISVNCFLRAVDWEYRNTEPEIPTPATRTRTMETREELGDLV